MPRPADDPWFDRAFGPGYHRFYPHRDEGDAQADVQRILDRADVDPRRPTLDLCCGDGRHLLALGTGGGFTDIVGLDRSPYLLGAARQRLGGCGRLVRGDIRALPFPGGAFDLVLNLFTSFGYFADDDEHRQALCEVRRILTRKGRLHMDHVDRLHLEQNLVPQSEETRDGVSFLTTRRIVGDRVEKRLVAADGSVDHQESVRLWHVESMRELLRRCNFGEISIATEAGRMRVWAIPE